MFLLIFSLRFKLNESRFLGRDLGEEKKKKKERKRYEHTERKEMGEKEREDEGERKKEFCPKVRPQPNSWSLNTIYCFQLSKILDYILYVQ